VSLASLSLSDAGHRKGRSNFVRRNLLDLAEAAREASTKIRDLQQARSQK
jgi:hypothetical protein